MKFKPRKRVGSPASFRGVRGTYLTTMLMYIGGSLFLILIFLMLPLPMPVKLVLTLIVIGCLLYKYEDLKKLSKGDLNKSLKSSCRKTFVIKPKKL